MKTRPALTFGMLVCLGCFASNAAAQYSSDPFGPQPFPTVVAPIPVAVASPPIPADARKIAAQYEADKAAIEKDARKQIRKLRVALAAALETLQGRYAHDAMLDEAVAIRDCIRGLGGIQPMPDPGVLFAYSNAIGRPLFFRVTGDRKKAVWGTNPYTPDSGLASAAVHAGVLKAGQTGVVKVTMLPGRPSYSGSTKNGFTSSKWGSSPVSYLVERVTEKDEDAAEAPSPMSPVPSPAMPHRVMTYGAPNGYNGYVAAPRVEWSEAPRPRAYVRPTATLSAAKLPGDAQRLVDDFHAESAAIHKSAKHKIAGLRHKAISDLKPLQDTYTRQTKLDEAVAIRDYVRQLKQPDENVLADPGSPNAVPLSIGRVFYFRVTGRQGGTVWGTDIYTADSALATAAVHAGVLKEGQTGVVKVTILPRQNAYQGSTRNGITSGGHGPYPISYRVEPADVEEDVEEQPHRKSASKAADFQADKSLARQVEDLRQEVSRLDRSLREVLLQMKQRREEEQMLKNPPPLR